MCFLYSCAEKNTNIARNVIATPKKSQEKITFPDRNEKLYNDQLKSLFTTPQIFLISNSSDTTLVGTNGATISIPASCFMLDGKPVTGLIQIQLIELTKKSDFVLNNKPTVSDRKMLLTGGSIYINAKQGSKNLTIGCETGITISIPNNSYTPGMELFLGKSINKGNNTWVKDSSLSPIDMEGIVINDENYYEEGRPLTIEEKQLGRLTNYMFSTNQFGWINCDAFYNDTINEKVELIVKIPQGIPEDYTVRVYAVFKKLNSVMQLYTNDNEKFSAAGLPSGEEIYLIALAARDNVILIDLKSSTITKDIPITVSLKATTKEAVKKEMENIN
jgi:hypothetical protein